MKVKGLLLGLVCLAQFSAIAGDDGGRFDIRNLEMNSEESDFGPAFFNGRLVFASSRDINTIDKRRWDGNDRDYYDLFVANPGGAGELQDLKYFKRKLNKKFNEGPASFDKDAKFMVFTQNQYDRDEVKTLKIVTSNYEDGKWSDPIDVPFNHPDYNVGQPSLSLDGKTLYFTSDMPGGFGGTDIYKVNRNEDGTWGRPVNLGDKVNSTKNEMFPFIHREGMLFFASDKIGGLGGLDIYMANVFGTIGDITHLDAPVNSPADDFSFILSTDQYSGYFASNRDGGKGSDDIYYFTNKEKFANIS